MNGRGRGPFVLRQRKRLAKGDPIKLEGRNSNGSRIRYSGVVQEVLGRTVFATIRTEDGLLDVTLELPE